MTSTKSIKVRNNRTGQIITASKEWVTKENNRIMLEGGGLQDLNKVGLWVYESDSKQLK